MNTAKLLLIVGLSMLGLAACSTGAPTVTRKWSFVRIGMAGDYPPFLNLSPTGGEFGWEIDYATELCKRMQVTCTFPRHSDWPSLIPALLGGEFDVILSSLAITPQRQKLVNFSDVYYATPIVFLGRATDGSNDISPEALKGKTIGTQNGTIYADYLTRFYKDSKIKLDYSSVNLANADLANGRLDYVVTDMLVATAFIAKQSNGCCRMVAEIPRDPGIFGPGIGAAFRPQDTDLLAMFNKAIAEVDADGIYQKIAGRYFTFDIRGK